MKPGLQVGDQQRLQLLVTEAMVPKIATDAPDRASQKASVIHPLYATASMMAHMEWAARQHILPYLEDGEEGVGYQVNIKHLSPTPVGASVTIESTVTAIDARRVVSAIKAWNRKGLIGEGEFIQALVSRQRLYQAAQDVLTESELQPDGFLGETKYQSNSPRESSITLRSMDGQTSFLLELLQWESPFPCTPYDEWIVCRAVLDCGGLRHVQEGPFLLRFEVEQLLENLQSRPPVYQSDFMESKLRVELTNKGKLPTVCTITLGKTPPISFAIAPDSVSRFCQTLTDRLAELQGML